MATTVFLLFNLEWFAKGVSEVSRALKNLATTDCVVGNNIHYSFLLGACMLFSFLSQSKRLMERLFSDTRSSVPQPFCFCCVLERRRVC